VPEWELRLALEQRWGTLVRGRVPVGGLRQELERGWQQLLGRQLKQGLGLAMVKRWVQVGELGSG